jgi:ATP-dependent helicase/nuclease subunit B
MSRAFLEKVAEYIHSGYKDNAEKLCVVLPNKRGALFLKRYLAKEFKKTSWLPAIISSEEFISELSGVTVPDEIDLVCHLYESYRQCYGEGAEAFDSFAKWGQLILQDFNEIDRYLVDPTQIYENLKDIKVIENWSLGEEKLTEHQTAYLRFMNSLGAIYQHYKNFLLSKGWAYQGLAYREASRKSADSTVPDKYHKVLLCGFNALNAAEISIFKTLLSNGKAEIIWDADNYYLKDEKQEAGMFMRRNLQLFTQKDPLFISEGLSSAKKIEVISVPKQVGQAQVIKQALTKMLGSGIEPSKIAVVLANEKLLWPVLHQLPEEVNQVNITMEYPIRYTSTYSLLEILIQLQINFSRQKRKHKTIYHKDLEVILRHPDFRLFCRKFKINANRILEVLTTRNLSFIGEMQLKELFGESFTDLKPLLTESNSVQTFCETLQAFISSLAEDLKDSKTSQSVLQLEYVYILKKNFNRLREVISIYGYFNDLPAFRQLFTQLVGSASAPFIGEPLAGLQLMGVLETRTLDFSHVIFVNVNEGVLPSGKSINSFIPNDLKRAFGLPSYTEKDAVYAYHFYRLLQRAEEVVITFDSETDTFGKGEKSRFITQLQLEMPRVNPNVKIVESVATYAELPKTTGNVISIGKNAGTLDNILRKATGSGKYESLSPSALITFKECGLKFYMRYGVKLKETQEVEESAEANTFGSILHLSLETLYKNLAGSVLLAETLELEKKRIDEVVHSSFLSFFGENAPVGKSLLQEEVIKVYVRKLVDHDIRFIGKLNKENSYLTLTALEQEYSATLMINVRGGQQAMFLRGKADRIDSYQGLVRIIDYKSSVKDSDRFIFDGFEKLFHDKNYDKQLQLLLYAWLIFKNTDTAPEKLLPCIVPFKVFGDPRIITGSDKKRFVFSNEFFSEFEQALAEFIGGIFNEELPFAQTDDKKVCEYCSYNVVCNFHP